MAAGTALLVRSVTNLYAIDPGLEAGGLAVLDVALPSDMTAEQRRALLNRLTDELAALPGVRAAALRTSSRCAAAARAAASGRGPAGPRGHDDVLPDRVPGLHRGPGHPRARGPQPSPRRPRTGPPAEGGETPVADQRGAGREVFPRRGPGRALRRRRLRRPRAHHRRGRNAAEARLTDARRARALLAGRPFGVRGQRADAGAPRTPGLDAASLLEPARRAGPARWRPAVAVAGGDHHGPRARGGGGPGAAGHDAPDPPHRPRRAAGRDRRLRRHRALRRAAQARLGHPDRARPRAVARGGARRGPGRRAAG